VGITRSVFQRDFRQDVSCLYKIPGDARNITVKVMLASVKIRVNRVLTKQLAKQAKKSAALFQRSLRQDMSCLYRASGDACKITVKVMLANP
jgi:hypothetical protein